MDEAVLSAWTTRRDEALADLGWKQSVQRTEKARADALSGLRDLLGRFLSRAIEVEAFRGEFDRRSRQEWSTFGLGGFAGGMFLNKLAKHIPDQAQLGAQLRSALAVPANEAEAQEKLATFSAYLEGLIAAGSATRAQVDPPRVSVFVPFWWHVQAPEAWPVFFVSARKALAETRAIPTESTDAAGYIAFRKAFLELSAALGLNLLEVEQLCKRPVGGAKSESGGEEAERPARRSVWLIQPGPRGRQWEEWVAHELCALGGDQLGDLSKLSYEDIFARLSAERTDGTSPRNDALACHEFAHVMRVGDVVIAKRGRSEIIGYGLIKTEYRYDPSRPEYHHVRGVGWIHSGSWHVRDKPLVTKGLTDITRYSQLVADIHAALGIAEPEPEPTSGPARGPEEVSPEDAFRDVFVPRGVLDRALALLKRRKNLVLQGPPGVGKTFVAKKLAYALLGARDPEHVKTVQFHQSYTYEQFVRGYRPTEEGGFERADGPFLDLCDRAKQDPENPYVLIVDEINRGNLSKILGDLMMLIEHDKRREEWATVLTYSKPNEQPFFVPENLHIIGTMNTADRSLALVDYALRRRFVFETVPPGFETDGFAKHLAARGATAELVGLIKERLSKLNQQIRTDAQLGEGFLVGHSYFVPEAGVALDEEWYQEVVETEILPLLTEYWVDSPNRVKKARELLYGEG